MLISISTLTLSCENDEIFNETEQEDLSYNTVTKSEAQNLLHSFQKKREKMIKNASKSKTPILEIIPDWDSFHQEELSFTEALLSTIEIQTNAQATVNSRIVFLNVDTKAVRLIESKQVLNQVDDELIDGFVYYHDMDGKFIVGYTVEQGQVTKRLTQPQPSKGKRSTKATSMFKSSCEEEFDMFNISPCHGHLDEVIITATVATESSPTYYFLYDFGSGFAYADYNIYGESFEDTQGGGGSNGDDNNSEEDRIKNELDGKALCVFNKLTTMSTSFTDAIQLFDGDFPVAHLKLKLDYSLPNTTNAVTNNSNTNFIEIRINGNTILNRTVLGLARTFAHETIHAELYRKVRSVGGRVSINDFPGIYDYYRRHVKNWQHEQMAAHYRNTIVNILRDFDNNVNSSQFYNDLAWEGLQNTSSWLAQNQEERNRIINAILDYKNSGEKNCN